MATNQKKVFEQFTNQYALSKTLRFELKPVGKTREWMDKHLEYDADLQTFLKDQKIENAYRTLKPIFDSLHEEFISESLESETVSKIDFSQYLEKYKNKQTLGEKDLAKIEKGLRIQIGNSYQEVAKLWKEKAGKDSKGKDVLKKKGFNILTESGILEYIRKNADQFVGIQTEEKILNALGDFKGFFTYLSGFNQNRENYYAIKDEKATAVATRIVHDNLPKFCDNFLALEARESEYLTAYSYLEETGNSLVDKDGKKLWPIQMDLFDIGNFNKYLSQNGIDTYNKQISNANFLINLYNQLNSKESGFKKLQLFKTLFKQIGCGEREGIIFCIDS
jgi:CRISPR-associated protein Cpf1